MIHNSAVLEAQLDVYPYFARVPTHSNIGDNPSRGFFSELVSKGSILSEVTRSMIIELIASPA